MTNGRDRGVEREDEIERALGDRERRDGQLVPCGLVERGIERAS